MTTRNPRPSISPEQRARLQRLLDEADRAWFSKNPRATSRIRFHFLGEEIEGDAEPTRHVLVRIERDRLVRRFTDAEVAA